MREKENIKKTKQIVLNRTLGNEQGYKLKLQ